MRREIRFEPYASGFQIRFLLHGSKGTMQFLILVTKQSGPMGVDIGYHSDTPRYEGQSSSECTFRNSGICYYDGSSIAAEELFNKFLASDSDEIIFQELNRRYEALFGKD